VRNSYAALLIASPDSRASNYVAAEMALSEMYKRPIFPLWIHGADWIDSVALDFVRTQHIDLRGDAYANGIIEVGDLLRALQEGTVVSVVKPHTGLDDSLRRNPYKGLRAFSGDDAGDFFGRGALVRSLADDLAATLAEDLFAPATEVKPPQRLLAVVGPSGSGKSSVVMAGLYPYLKNGGLPGSAHWRYLPPIVPGRHPLTNLAIALANATHDSVEQVLDDLSNPRRLHRMAGMMTGGTGNKLVVFIDQFEEVFTQVEDEDEARQFIELLVNAATEPRGSAIILLTLRADFYDCPMNDPALGKLLEGHSRSVLPMTLQDLRDVIEKPAALPDVRVQFEDGLIGDLLYEVRSQAGALPLLQFTLAQLFDKRTNDLLTLKAYRELGGVHGALSKHAEAVYEGLPSDQHRLLARALFLRLIEPGMTEQNTTRRRAALDELNLADSAQSQVLNQTANVFVNARLLVTDQIEDIETIEVSHEALIREWGRLSRWLRDAREDVRVQKKINADVSDWARQKQS